MKFSVVGEYLPGTIIKKEEISGKEFLDRIFFIADGIPLSQVREISGVDGSTLQNWVKRGWIGNTVHKKYSKNQLARILIINMLRSCMLFERIDRILHFINGRLDDESDDIVPEADLYDFICRVIRRFEAAGLEDMAQLERVVREELVCYWEPVDGAKERLTAALKIIVVAYFASCCGELANTMYENLG